MKSAKNSIIQIYKTNASKKNLKFELSKDEAIAIMSSSCYYCGQPPSNIWKSNNREDDFIYNCLDRKDNNDGYNLDNCVPCCNVCNYLKGTMSSKEFLSIVFRIAENRCSSTNTMELGELVEKLSIANSKLFELCSMKDDAAQNPNKYSKDELRSMAKRDIELCKERASLKSRINRVFYGNRAIIEVKNYG